MNSVALWRTVAVVAVLGWAGTSLSWALSSAPEAHTPPRDLLAQVDIKVPVRSPRLQPVGTPVQGIAAPQQDLDQLRDEVREQVRNEVLDEIEQERAERHQQRSEQHLSRLIDDVAQFAEEHGLDADAQAALEGSMAAMHDRLEELRPPGPPGPGGPPPEALKDIEQSFEQMRAEVAESLDDPDLADAFADRMMPRPLRDRQ